MNEKIGRFGSRTSTRSKMRGRRGDNSILSSETVLMTKELTANVQQGHGQFAKVHVVEHNEPNQAAVEGEYQNDPKLHPNLNSQRFDGKDLNESDLPINSEARREFDNQKREQEHQLRLKHNLMPKMGSAPEFKPG